MAEQRNPTQQSANDKFYSHFQGEAAKIQAQIDSLVSLGTTGGERADAIDHCLSGIAKLSIEANEASSYAPAHDQRVYSNAVKTLNKNLQETRASFAPRPKFAFKNGLSFPTKKNESAISLNDAAELASQRRRQTLLAQNGPSGTSSATDSPPGVDTPGEDDSRSDMNTFTGARLPDGESPSIRQPSFSQSTSVSISRHDNVHIMLPAAAGHATSSGTLSNIRGSVVDMSIPTITGRRFAGLTLTNITSSLIICGHVDGAAFLNRVHDSVIVVLSRQFRMHDSSNCTVYLNTLSSPIIEDCSDIRFAPAPELYLLPEHLSSASEKEWSKVQDFKWLQREPSPNWSLLEIEKCVPGNVWKDVVPGGPDLGVADVLRAVGIRM